MFAEQLPDPVVLYSNVAVYMRPASRRTSAARGTTIPFSVVVASGWERNDGLPVTPMRVVRLDAEPIEERIVAEMRYVPDAPAVNVSGVNPPAL